MGSVRRYSNEHSIAVVRLLALRLWRSPTATEWKENGCRPCHALIWERFGKWYQFLETAGLPLPAYTPALGKAPPGGSVWWTPERIMAAMRQIREELGYFPRKVADYLPLKRGRMDWPTDVSIRGLVKNGSRQSDRSAWRNAMIKAGLVDDVQNWREGAWSEHDDEYLLEHAGRSTLKRIAFHLGRTYGACRRRLYDLGTRARDARGYYTASVLAQELHVPLGRVTDAIHSGLLDATKPLGVYYQIDPESIERARPWLTRPRITHKTFPVYTKWTRATRRNGDGSRRKVHQDGARVSA